jgi:outer membrane protein OmpA-like peptidoglycan-associated protein
MKLDICPNNYNNFPVDSPPLTCACSAKQAKADDTIWGANPYMSTSSICRAAVHAGAISTSGGEVIVTPKADVPVFPSVTRNDVESASTRGGEGFVVDAAAGAGTAVAPLQSSSTGMKLDICPNNYNNFPVDSPPLTCACSAKQAKAGDTIWGTNPYMSTSSICRAAVHAGAISTSGGEVIVTPKADVPVFPSVTRNSIESASTSGGEGFMVAVIAGAKPAEPSVDASSKPIQAPIASTLKETGRVQLYVNFATDSAEPLSTSASVLAELLATLRDTPDLKLELIGHTDNEGSANYNLDLSQRRAAGIYFFLVKSGIDAGRLRSSGRGLMEPISDNTTAGGRALNRRVEAKQIQ